MGILTVKTVGLFLCFAAALHQGWGQFGYIAVPNRNFYYRAVPRYRLPVTQYRPLVPQYFRGFYPLPRVVQAQPQTRRVSPIRQFLNLWAWNRVFNPPATAPPPTTEMPTTPTTIPTTSVTTSTAATTEATTASSTTSTTIPATPRPVCNDIDGQSGGFHYTVQISAGFTASTASGACQNSLVLIDIQTGSDLSGLIAFIRSTCGGTSAIIWTATTKSTIDGIGGGNSNWYNSIPPITEPAADVVHRIRVDATEAGFLPHEEGATADGALCT